MTESEIENLTADFAGLLRRARADDATSARIRERHLRSAAAADATMVGLLVDAAERAEELVIRTDGGRTLVGRVVHVTIEVVAIESPTRLLTYIPIAGIGSFRIIPGTADGRDASGDRSPTRRTSWATVVAELASTRPRVRIGIRGEPSRLAGELRSAGVDVITLALDGNPPVTAHVALNQLSELTVLASG
jgi:hypothetical protein